MSAPGTMPLPISAVVVNFDGAAYLEACLAALEVSQGGLDEILLVDNASSDDSLAIAARHPRVRVQRLDRNEGPCPARNAGLRAARNAWVLLVDNDAILEPDCAARLYEAALAGGAGVALVQPRSVFDAEPGRVHYDGGELHYAGLIALRNFYTPLEQAAGRGTLEVGCAVSVVLLAARERVLAAGGFDARYFILFEDLDLSYRLRACGGRILSVEDALVRHKGGTSGISYRQGPRYPARRVFLHARNRWIFLAKNYRGRTLVLCAPGLLLYELAGFGFALLAGAPLAWVRGKFGFLGQLRGLRADRARLQRERTLGDRELLVGGPLTTTPDALAGGARARAQRALSAALRAWWALVRPLC